LADDHQDVETLKHLETGVRLSPEIRGYIHNVVVFARMHRAVGSGVTALATRNFNKLARALAPFHGLSYVSPSLVALAARKVYTHRITITAPENERSMQWGSSLEAVKEMLDGVTPEDVIEEVLQAVEVPL
jgi:MoxR-like ATPase